MSAIKLAQIKHDEKTGALLSELRVGQLRVELPNRFPISPERNALRPAGVKDPLPGEVSVLARLAPPDMIKKLLTQEDVVKSTARFLSKEAGPDSIRLLFLAFRGGASLAQSKDLKTILDLQFLAGLDVITIQHTMNLAIEDFDADLKFAEKWAEERGVDKPLMPVIQAPDNKEMAVQLLKLVEKHGHDALGFDLRGGFYYHSLREIEEFKKRKPEIWVHAFQVPPKVRFGRGLLSCSEGMILPMFGVDSFSRWIVPPPPTPLTKDVINVFDRKGWGSLKKKDYESLRDNNPGCKCQVCQGKDLEPFYEGKVLEVLAKAKVHDHLAQREELDKTRQSIKKGEYLGLLRSKEYPREFLKYIPKEEPEG